MSAGDRLKKWCEDEADRTNIDPAITANWREHRLEFLREAMVVALATAANLKTPPVPSAHLKTRILALIAELKGKP